MMKEAFLELCAVKAFTLEEIAVVLKKEQKSIKNHYIYRLKSEKKLTQIIDGNGKKRYVKS